MTLQKPVSDGLKRLSVMQGNVEISRATDVMMTTVLGSCVACCMFDPVMRVGGMNHFLLSEPGPAEGSVKVDEHYGVYLMEVLINGMLSQGVRKQSIKAHLYGGANLHANMQKIGSANAQFAQDFLARENIQLFHMDLGGTTARRVDFIPAQGRVRCRVLKEQVEVARPVLTRPATDRGDVELF
jgi:chemotaxis protein CheD